MDCGPPGFSVHGIFQTEYWSGLLFPSPGDLPDPVIKPCIYSWKASSLPLSYLGLPTIQEPSVRPFLIHALVPTCLLGFQKDALAALESVHKTAWLKLRLGFCTEEPPTTPAICHSNHQLGVVRDTSYWHHADFDFALCVCNVWSKSTWAQYLLAAQPVEVWPASLAAEAVILIALSATILLPGECLTLKSRDETNFPRLHRCRSWETDQVVWLELDKGKFIWHDS